MNRFVILVLISLAITVGYLLGTEQGRAQRDLLLAKLYELKSGGGDEAAADGVDLTEAVEEAVSA